MISRWSRIKTSAVIAFAGLIFAIGACSSDEPIVGGTGPGPSTGPATCFDADQDTFIDATCGGTDCDDSRPYVNPEGVDGPWSLETRYVTHRELVQWFSIEGDATHWLTQSIDLASGTDPEALRYYTAEGIGFGIPQIIDETPLAGHKATLLLNDGLAHVLHHVPISGHMIYINEASAWEPTVIAANANHISRMVAFGDELHAIYWVAGGDMGMPMRHAVLRDGQWETNELGAGRADQLLLGPAGQLHILSSDATICFHHGQSMDGESWSFEDYEHAPNTGCEVLDAVVGLDQRMYALYRSTDGFFLASFDQGQWSAVPVDPPLTNLDQLPLPQRASLQVDQDGVAHVSIAFADVDNTPLIYLTNGTGEWVHEIVAKQLSHEMVLTPEGEPMIALSRTIHFSTAPQLVIARRTGNDGIDQNCNGVDGN